MSIADKLQQARGKCPAFLREHASYVGDDCILWPFSRNPINGYGQIGVAGLKGTAHQTMCELVNGLRPSPKHQAAHSCHQPACITPRHLSWKTPSKNMLDKRENGTARVNTWGRGGKLTWEQVQEIRSLAGIITQAEIAKRFNVTESNIRNIRTGKTWPKPHNYERVITALVTAPDPLNAAEIMARAEIETMTATTALLYRMTTRGQIERAGRGLFRAPRNIID